MEYFSESAAEQTSKINSSWRKFVPILLSILMLTTQVFGTTGISANPNAFLKTGKIDDASWLLPNGRMIKPSGKLIEVGAMPLGIALSPNGMRLYVTNGGVGAQAITVINTEEEKIVQVVPETSLYLGIAVSPDGKYLYVSGGGDRRIHVFDIDENGLISENSAWKVKGVPAGLSLSPDGGKLFYVSSAPRMVHIVDTKSGKILNSSFTGKNPYSVIANPVKKEVYVSLEGENRVSVFNYTFSWWIRCTASFEVGKNPQGMAISGDGKFLFVMNSDDDSFTIIDLDKREIVAEPDLHPYFLEAPGTAPNAAALSPDGNRLFIVQGSENRIAVISLPEGRLIGAIPTAWYPTAVAVSGDGQTIFTAGGKGTGTSPVEEGNSLVNHGTVQITQIPSDSLLATLLDSIRVFNSLPGNLFSVDTTAFSGPVPLFRGGETPVKHIFFIVKENKTYDALLGDWEMGDGDPSNCVYCYDETRNLHALVETFSSGDNYYSNAEASIQGHCLTTSAITNTFVEKQWAMENRTIPIEADIFLNPTAWPKNDYIFHNALKHGISFRDYGESVGMGDGWLILDPKLVHWSLLDPPVFFLLSRDVDKLRTRILDWELLGVPRLVYMLFPNDHTMGYQWPYPTPEEMVADNDLAIGRFMGWLSHSEYWESSLTIIIEDDPQEGSDHVDNHRSIVLLAGPWVDRGYVSHVHYSEANIHSTIEHILNLPPMTVYDEIAQPMWDMFADEPDYTPFDPVEYGKDFISETFDEVSSVDSRPPDMFNFPGTEPGAICMGMNFIDPDEADGLQEVLKEGASVRVKASLESTEKEDALIPYPLATAFNGIRKLDESSNPESLKSELFTERTISLVKDYLKLRVEANADFLPEDPLMLLAGQLDKPYCRVTGAELINNMESRVHVHYINGMTGTLSFTKESGKWKLDMSGELSSTNRLLKEESKKLATLRKAMETGIPVMQDPGLVK